MSASDFPPAAFRRDDESSDALFYSQPRLVTHIDDAAIAAVTQIYREFLPRDGAVLDLMSSWISHLPAEIQYAHVAGLGMNRAELAANPRLHRFVVHDLNQNPVLPFDAASFDAATICVSIDYLTDPVAVLRDLSRVVRAGGPLVITFSNRCFPTKAIHAWLSTDDAGRVGIVKALLVQSGRWSRIEALDRSPARGRSDPLFCVLARSMGPAHE
jgi:SAM-dependent methyltransferase